MQVMESRRYICTFDPLSAILDLIGSGFAKFPGGLGDPILHQRIEFEHKWPLRDCFIDNLTDFPVV